VLTGWSLDEPEQGLAATDAKPRCPEREVRRAVPEERMSEANESRTGTYRCPVCGHRDSAELASGQDLALIRCSYCNTALEVRPRGADSIRLKVQVSEQPAAS
jgi:DNA-directed RNA polymerase subunit RPC12/RpoP